jgi:hypothetical protein
MCCSTVLPCFDTITQNGTNAALIKQQFIVEHSFDFLLSETRVKNSESPLGPLYRPSRVRRKCQSFVESHSQVFDLRRPCHFLSVKYNSSARKSSWRRASSEINGLCFRSVHFYLPLFEVIRQWVELQLKHITDFHRFWVGHKHGSVICECHKLTPIGRGGIRWINYIRLEIKRHHEVDHMEYYSVIPKSTVRWSDENAVLVDKSQPLWKPLVKTRSRVVILYCINEIVLVNYYFKMVNCPFTQKWTTHIYTCIWFIF